MSVINKKPFIEEIIGSLAQEEKGLFLELLNGKYNAPTLKSYINPSLALSVSDKGVSYIALEVENDKFTGYLIYNNTYCVLLSYDNALDGKMKIISLDYANSEYSISKEKLSIDELRAALTGSAFTFAPNGTPRINGNLQLLGEIVDAEGNQTYEHKLYYHPILVEETGKYSFSLFITNNSPEAFEDFEDVIEYCQRIGITLLFANGGGKFGAVTIDSLSAIRITASSDELAFYGYDNNTSVALSSLNPDHFYDGVGEEQALVLGVNGIGGSSPTLTRTDNAVGKTYSFNANNVVVSDFDNLYPYNAMAIVEDALGNKFLRVPKFYTRKIYNEDGTIGLRISNIKLPNYHTLFVAVDEENNLKELPYIDIGCYEASKDANNKLESKSGKTILVSQTMATFRTYAQANGDGYQIEDYLTREIINELFMIEFATTNAQSVFVGVTDGSNASGIGTTGATDSITGDVVSGKLSLSSALTADGSFKYRGLENIYGDYWEFVDGISFSAEKVYLSIKPSDYASAKITDSYKEVGTRGTTNGYAKAMAKFNDDESELNDIYNLLGYTTEVGGSASTYYCDYCYYDASGTILLVGGLWADGAYAGLFYLYGNLEASYAADGIGARLVKKPI